VFVVLSQIEKLGSSWAPPFEIYEMQGNALLFRLYLSPPLPNYSIFITFTICSLSSELIILASSSMEDEIGWDM
jgi:hypothetical protein